MANRHIGGNPLGASKGAMAVLGDRSRSKTKKGRKGSVAARKAEAETEESISASAARGMAKAPARKKSTRRKSNDKQASTSSSTGAAGLATSIICSSTGTTRLATNPLVFRVIFLRRGMLSLMMRTISTMSLRSVGSPPVTPTYSIERNNLLLKVLRYSSVVRSS